jgi:S-adenosylmethionine:tRNA ribosyltransferase-isomerase
VLQGLPDRKITIGETLYVRERPCVQAISQRNEEFTFKILIPPGDFDALCYAHGQTPLPPYIQSPLSEEQSRARYQTVFADKPASVAAPTASLHFTDKVFMSLASKGIEKTQVTLHVGRGTFSPLAHDMVEAGKLHKEPIYISKEAATQIAAKKKEHKLVVASGTTVVRSLESTADAVLASSGYTGETSILIKPPYQFRVVDALITNFHIPNTSLLMLIDAFLQSKGAEKSWRDLYEIAIKEQFKFYSFGDSMLII